MSLFLFPIYISVCMGNLFDVVFCYSNEPGSWTYRYRFAKAAASSLPPALVGPAHAPEGESPTMSRVAIGEGGVIKIVHLVHMNKTHHGEYFLLLFPSHRQFD